MASRKTVQNHQALFSTGAFFDKTLSGNPMLGDLIRR